MNCPESIKMKSENTKKQNYYNDIIDLPHHVSSTHVPMSIYERAAQFAPFSALTGYEEAIEEAIRVTEEKRDLSGDTIEILNRTLAFLERHMGDGVIVSVTYFMHDKRKAGGSYVTTYGEVVAIDEYEKQLVLSGQRKIPFADITDLEIKGNRKGKHNGVE